MKNAMPEDSFGASKREMVVYEMMAVDSRTRSEARRGRLFDQSIYLRTLLGSF